MRTRVKNYTFTAGTRQITVTDNLTFTKSDIAVIVNRTQQKVLFTVPDYNLITDVTNKVITYDNSLPVLAENDILWIEIDIEVSATKLVKVNEGVIEVNGEYHPNDWNIEYELAQHTPIDYPYCFIAKFPKYSATTPLSGADAYYTSDGNLLVGNQTHTWTDESNGKGTRYVIFAFSTRNISVAVDMTGMFNIIELLFGDVNIGTINMANNRCSKVWCTEDTTFDAGVTRNYSFSPNTLIYYVDFPNLTTVGDNNWYGCSNLTYANFPNLTTVGARNWQSCINLIYANYPNLTTVGYHNWYGCTNLVELTIGTLTLGTLTSWVNNNIQGCTSLTKLVIGANTDIALDFRYGVALTVDNIRDYIVPNLKDNTGLTAKTITFATAVYNALVAAGYIAFFTARNWNVAAA